MRRGLAVLALVLFAFVPIGVRAQTGVHLSSASVDIWPEYDQSAVLVIYHINLAADTPLPAHLTLRVPAQAQVSAVAVADSGGNLYNASYDRTQKGDWSSLTISAETLQVQVEYYTPLQVTGITRHILYRWPGDYAIQVLDVNFLEPVGATNVKLTPAAKETNPGQGGLTNYHIQIFNPTQGTSFSVAIDYDRTTSDLSIANLPIEPVATPGATTPGRVSMTGFLPGFLLGLGVVLIAAGVTGFLLWRRGGKRPAGSRRHASRLEARVDEVVYCQECGKRAQPGDVYCRTCGTRLRQASSGQE